MKSFKKTIFAELHNCCLDIGWPNIYLIVWGFSGIWQNNLKKNEVHELPKQILEIEGLKLFVQKFSKGLICEFLN